MARARNHSAGGAGHGGYPGRLPVPSGGSAPAVKSPRQSPTVSPSSSGIPSPTSNKQLVEQPSPHTSGLPSRNASSASSKSSSSSSFQTYRQFKEQQKLARQAVGEAASSGSSNWSNGQPPPMGIEGAKPAVVIRSYWERVPGGSGPGRAGAPPDNAPPAPPVVQGAAEAGHNGGGGSGGSAGYNRYRGSGLAATSGASRTAIPTSHARAASQPRAVNGHFSKDHHNGVGTRSIG